MRALLYLVIILYCFVGKANELVSNSENNLAIKYQEYKRLAMDGDINSQYEIFNLVNNNKPKLNKNLTEAFKFMIKAGEAGHTEAQFTIGSMYQTGNLLTKNSDVALTWLLEAAKSGHRKAQLLAGNNYFVRALDVTDEEAHANVELARYWYEKSIENNYLVAIKQYGLFLFMYEKFSPKADKLLNQVAETGDSDAMNWLGKLYSHRWGENRRDTDFALAHSWFEKAKLNGYDSQPLIDELNEKNKNYLEKIAREKSK